MTITVKQLLQYGHLQLKAVERMIAEDNSVPSLNMGMTKEEVLSELANSGPLYTHEAMIEWISTNVFSHTLALDAHHKLFIDASLVQLRNQHKIALLNLLIPSHPQH